MTTFNSLRYMFFAKKADEILKEVLDERKDLPKTENHSYHSTHISKILTIDEVQDILTSEELLLTESWVMHTDNLKEIDVEKLFFDVYKEANILFEKSENKRSTVAQILALNDSLISFTKVLAFWVENQDIIETLISSASEFDSNTGYDMDVVETIKESLRSESDEIMPEDLDDAALFVYGASK